MGPKVCVHLSSGLVTRATPGAADVIPPNADLDFEVELLAIDQTAGTMPGALPDFPVLCEPQTLTTLGPGHGHPHTASVLLMHGFGDTAEGWREPATWLAQRLPHVRFVLPTAPVSQTMSCTSWFDLHGPDEEVTFDESLAVLARLIDAEIQIVGADRVIVAGFSQGGALAYSLGLCTQRPIGGVVALSTFWPGEKVAATGATATTPVLICHGTADDRIPGGVTAVQKTRGMLKTLGIADVELMLYEGMGHSASMAELNDVLRWMRRVVPGDDPEARL